MPRPGSPGRPDAGVVPEGWEEHHEPVVAGTFTARCRLRDPSQDTEGVLDPTNGTYPVVKATPYYDDVCRIQQLHQPQSGETAGQRVSTHDYLLQVLKTVIGVRIGHAVEIYDATDTSLNGLELEVSDVMRGSLTWSRDLVCLDNLARR